MPRSSDATRDHILTAAYDQLYKEGFARVTMDAIARSAQVTKRTLYYHFDSKDALVAAVLNQQRVHALAHIRSWANDSAADPADFLAGLFTQLGRWSSQPGWLGSGFTRLTMELADMPGHPARRASHHHKLAVEMWLADKLAALGARDAPELARQVMLLIEGCLSLILIHGDPTYAAAAAKAARRLAGSEPG